MKSKKLDAIVCLLDSARGVFIPRDFVAGFDLQAFSITLSASDAAALSDPDNVDYWEAWQKVENDAVYTHDNGDVFTLWQGENGDLFMLCDARLTDEEKQDIYQL